MLKKCSKCQLEKELSEFHAFKGSKDGLYGHCKSCKQNYDKKYRKSDKVQKAQKSQKYRDRKTEYAIFRNKDPRIQMLISAKARAKLFNLPFNITIEDLIIPDICPLLEIPIFKKPYNGGGKKSSFLPNSPSLDKIVPELGYVKENIMVMSMKANAMKYNATIEELKTFAKNILQKL